MTTNSPAFMARLTSSTAVTDTSLLRLYILLTFSSWIMIVYSRMASAGSSWLMR